MADGCGEKFRKVTIRKQLLMTYGGTVCMVFLAALIIQVISIYQLRDKVINEANSALRTQIVLNGGYILSEESDLIEARLLGGIQRLALPTAISTFEASRTDREYSVAAPTSYPDDRATRLEQPTELDANDRYPCNMTEDVALRTRRGCRSKSIGDEDVAMKSISSTSSVVYLHGYRMDGTNVDEIMADQASNVNVTAHMDNFVADAWASSHQWMGAWIALSGTRPLMRSFPGTVGDLADDDGFRAYNPVTRPFYVVEKQRAGSSARIATTNEGQGRFSVSFTGPYLSAYGDGLLMSGSVPVHTPTTGSLMGVAGSDVKATVLADIVRDARIRESGAVHMYELASSVVAASPQWDASGHALMQAGDISLPFWKGHTLDESGGCESQEDADTHAVIKRPTLDGKYCLAAVVPGGEILRPIEEQRQEIMSASDELFAICAVVLLLCLLVLVTPCVLYMAMSLSSPLKRICAETNIMARNIGGDLLDGIDLSNTSNGPGEIGQLRVGFRRLLLRLKAKRDGIVVPPHNPLCGKLQFDPSEASLMSDIKVAAGTPRAVDQDLDAEPMEDVPLLSQIKSRLCLQLIMPMVIALSFVIVLTSVQMFHHVDEWIDPVKGTMVAEELQTMKIRASARAKYVEDVVGTYESMLIMVKSYAEKLYNDEFTLLTPPCSFHSPEKIENSRCPQFIEWDHDIRRMLTSDGRSTRLVDFDHMAWYHPQQATAPNNLRYSGTQASLDSPVTEHHGRSAHLANVARVAYFSSDTAYVYFGFESDEVYLQYPAQELSGFDQPMECFGGSRVPRFTPLCRPWYQNARAGGGEVKFSPVDVGAGTGIPYVSIGAAIYQGNTKLLGVASVDIDLGKLKQRLRDTPLYENGYVYMFDSEGYTVVHPDHEETSGRKKIVEVASAGDKAFADGYMKGIVEKYGSAGVWDYPWYNEATGKKETWYYSFEPVRGTPYQLVLAVVDREIEAAALQLEEDLKVVIITSTTVSTIFFVIGAIVLIYVSLQIQNRFVQPVMKISDLLKAAETDKGYKTCVPSDEGVWSYELLSVLGNFRHLMTALRFGNAAYHGGNKVKELEVLREAQLIVKETGNRRGQGVCLNNLGHCVRSMPEHQRAGLSEEEKNSTENLKRAVENARELADCSQGDTRIAAEDSYGLRCLGYGLALLSEDASAPAFEQFQNASNAYKKNGSWQKLAQLTFSIATLDKAKLPVKLLNWAADQSVEAIELANAAQSEGNPLEPQAGAAIAQLALSRGLLKSEWGLLSWCLATVPNLDDALVTRLARYAKCYVPQQVDAIDEAMAGRHGWTAGPISEAKLIPSPNKTLQFVLDCSHSMSGGYLDKCKQAIQNILLNYTSDGDHVGLLAFAHVSKDIFPITPRSGNLEMMKKSVADMDTFGSTAFYDAVLEGVQKVKKSDSGGSCWVVALTDGADTASKKDKGPGGQKLLREGGVNTAFITVGSLPQETINVIQGYVEATKSAGMEALHIEANDSAKIAEAFQAIAELMDNGLGEDL